MTKKTISILLAIIVSGALMACGGGKTAAGKTSGDPNSNAQTTVTAAETAEAGEQTTPAGSNAEGSTAVAAAAEAVDIPEKPLVRDDGGVSMDVFAMDTYMNLLAYGDTAEEAVLAAAQEIHRLDEMLSTGNPESEISKLNAAGTGEVSEDTLRLIEESQALYRDTGGLFDIAIYPVMKLWGFPTEQYRVPKEEEIEAALKLANVSRIAVGGAPATAPVPAQEGSTEAVAAPEKSTVSAETKVPEGNAAAVQTEASEGSTAAAAAEEAVPAADPQAGSGADSAKTTVIFGMPGMEIDLGGIAKGFTSSRVMEVFKEHGVEHGLVSLGGNVQALGAKENGNPWRVAIQNPESELDYLGVLEIEDKCVITSGGYERFFEKDGIRYHHIIDPRTGRPADSGVISATIISEDGALADGLSTSLFIMGKEQAEKFWRKNADLFDYVLEDADGKLYVTEGAANIITTQAEMEVVKK